MTITRFSAAEPFSKPHGFSAEGESSLAGRENRQAWLGAAAFRDASLGAKLSRAEAGLDLPLLEITDEHGRRLLLEASACRRVDQPAHPTARVVTLEAIAAREREDEPDVFARPSESQTS